MFHVYLQWPKTYFSISKFCHYNNVSMEFHPNFFLVKDLQTESILLRGLHKAGVYEWPTSLQSISAFPHIQAHLASKASLQDWHMCLGHPSDRVLHQINSSASLPVSLNKSLNCLSCRYNKVHKLMLKSFFQKNGISHFLSTSHSPEQNGYLKGDTSI